MDRIYINTVRFHPTDSSGRAMDCT